MRELKGLKILGEDLGTKTVLIEAPLERIDELLEMEDKFKVVTRLHVDADRMGELLTTEFKLQSLMISGVESWSGYARAMEVLNAAIKAQEEDES